MPFMYRYTIRYDYNSAETQIEHKNVPNEYISMHLKNKKPAPKRVITHEMAKSPYSVDYVVLRWEGEIQEGYTHVFPERLPCNCLLKIEYAVPLMNSRPDSISVPYVSNALAVFGSMVPLELQGDERFLHLLNWYVPKNPLRAEFSDSDEETSRISFRVGLCRRDIPIELFMKVQEIVSTTTHSNQML